MIRFFDIILSLTGLILLSPFLIIIAICIKIDSRGPVFYRQVRVGKENKDFSLIKFRSMHTASEEKGLLTVGLRDPRITRSGYFIRRYKLDEIPQLWNVLIGNMSFVGPRPEVRKYVNLYNPEQLKILSVRPGITDFASIQFAQEGEILKQYANPEKAYIEIIMPEKIKINMIFVENRGLKNYFKIIFVTLAKII